MSNLENDAVLSEVQANAVGIITLNRPTKHNAFDDSMIHALTQAFKQMEQNPFVKIVLLKSSGKSFSAGADLEWMRRMAKFNVDENLRDAGALHELMHTIYYCTKPTVAMVQGNAYGGGVGLVACCNIAIASSNASFCFSEVKLGLIPAIISPYVINAIGPRFARAYFLSAESFDAQTALQLGLVYRVTQESELENVTHELIKSLMNNGPQALKVVNAFMNKLTIAPEIANTTVQKLVEMRMSPEGQEGLSAFLEKRKPTWCKA
ncbi:MAG: enoyl-CoA hydratase/isomerase family protein [Proteobacteria bacterium]|nr:enoyl-CoA hydratase/isomerase family protein [Pseudomonadota bacterium]